jgi:hypothetical protein
MGKSGFVPDNTNIKNQAESLISFLTMTNNLIFLKPPALLSYCYQGLQRA